MYKMKKIHFFLAVLLVIITNDFYAQNLAWAAQFSSTAVCTGNSITKDAFGNIYTTGGFQGTVDFDPGIGIYTLTTFGSSDIYISKLDPNGNFVWAKQIGGTAIEAVTCITIDAAGNICLGGYFESITDFDPSPATYTLSGTVPSDMFVCKLDANGNFIWAKKMGGTGIDRVYSVVTDAINNVYTTGYFRSLAADFDPGPGTFTLGNTAGTEDVFVSKLDVNGNFAWANKMGGSGYDQGTSIAIDLIGNVYTLGFFASTNIDFDPGIGTFTIAPLGTQDVFIHKLDVSGNFVWCKQFGGTSFNVGNSLALDASNNIYSTGYFNAVADFDPGASTFNLASFGGSDIFISKLDVNGNFLWAAQIGGTSADVGNSISVDASGNCYSSGYFASSNADFDPGASTYTFATAGGNDVFVSKLNALGNFLSAYRISGPNNETGRGITCDNSANVYLTGDFQNVTDFDPGLATYTLSASGPPNVFVCKLNNLTASIDEISSPAIVTIFPNPNQGQFEIKLKNALKNGSIEVVNPLGETILSKSIIEMDNEIQIPDLSKGTYFVKILENRKVISVEKMILN